MQTHTQKGTPYNNKCYRYHRGRCQVTVLMPFDLYDFSQYFKIRSMSRQQVSPSPTQNTLSLLPNLSFIVSDDCYASNICVSVNRCVSGKVERSGKGQRWEGGKGGVDPSRRVTWQPRILKVHFTCYVSSNYNSSYLITVIRSMSKPSFNLPFPFSYKIGAPPLPLVWLFFFFLLSPFTDFTLPHPLGSFSSWLLLRFLNNFPLPAIVFYSVITQR